MMKQIITLTMLSIFLIILTSQRIQAGEAGSLTGATAFLHESANPLRQAVNAHDNVHRHAYSTDTAEGKASANETVYHGNIKTKVYHAFGCRYYDCGNCTVTFKTKGEAESAGYRPCKICRP